MALSQDERDWYKVPQGYDYFATGGPNGGFAQNLKAAPEGTLFEIPELKSQGLEGYPDHFLWKGGNLVPVHADAVKNYGTPQKIYGDVLQLSKQIGVSPLSYAIGSGKTEAQSQSAYNTALGESNVSMAAQIAPQNPTTSAQQQYKQNNSLPGGYAEGPNSSIVKIPQGYTLQNGYYVPSTSQSPNQPVTIPFKKGGTTEQYDSIKNLAANKPVEQWNADDKKNWNYYTGNKPLPLTANPVTPSQTSPGSGVPSSGQQAPTTPKPSAAESNASFMAGMQAAQDQMRKSFEAAKDQQIADAQAKMDAAQKKIDEFTAKQVQTNQTMLDSMPEPLRLGYEKAQEELLYVKKNFEDNQKLTDQLATLLSDGNSLIQQQKNATGLAAIKDPRLAQTISDVTSQAGVIQAVLAARNGQIAQAYTMIDRTVKEASAYRQDQLDYYKNIYNLYEGQKTDERNKLTTLTADQKTFLNAKIGLLESDMKRAEANADALKKAMMDPDTALAYARAGVTINDTAEQVGQKLAQDALAQSLLKRSQDLQKDGYTYLPSMAGIKSESEIYRETGADGKERIYKRPAPKLTEVSPGATLVDPTTGKPVFTAPTTKAQNGGGSGGSGGSGSTKTIKISADGKKKLLGVGLSSPEITNLERDISQYGIDAVLNGSGLTDKQQKEIRNLYNGLTEAQQIQQEKKENKFITPQYIAQFYPPATLEALASAAGYTKGGFFGIGKSADTQKYLTELMKTVENYRAQGLTDQEIFAKLDKKMTE